MNLESRIEAALFWAGEPVGVKELSLALEAPEEEITSGVKSLAANLSKRGIRIIEKDGEVALVTAPEASALIQSMAKNELSRDLGKAGLETIAIILYRGPVSRREIDYIRGVNSTFILRNLLVRGLVEKIQSKDDQRVFLYRPAFDLISYLGVSSLSDLPQYEENRREIAEALAKSSSDTENV